MFGDAWFELLVLGYVLWVFYAVVGYHKSAYIRLPPLLLLLLWVLYEGASSRAHTRERWLKITKEGKGKGTVQLE